MTRTFSSCTTALAQIGLVTLTALLSRAKAGMEAERQLATKPVERVLVGRRLLDKSRTALSRMMHLGLAWRLTGEKKYLERARAELLAVAAFADWNPKHFLDVGEMTAAVGIESRTWAVMISPT